MSLSKVIKNAGSFVPQKIIAKEDQPPVWKKLAQRVEEKITSSTTIGTQKNFRKDTEGKIISGDLTESNQFDSDFSAPDHDIESIDTDSADILHDLTNQQKMTNIEDIKEEYFTNGLQAGLERAENDYGSSTIALQSIFEQLNSIRETILSNSLVEMQNLVLQIVKKIIRQSISTQKHTILKTVEYAIQKAVKSDEFIISVNPDDYDIIKERSSDFINSLSGLENIILKPDTTVEQGGCLIESSNCTVDATISSQLDLIAENIKSKR